MITTRKTHLLFDPLITIILTIAFCLFHPLLIHGAETEPGNDTPAGAETLPNPAPKTPTVVVGYQISNSDIDYLKFTKSKCSWVIIEITHIGSSPELIEFELYRSSTLSSSLGSAGASGNSSSSMLYESEFEEELYIEVTAPFIAGSTDYNLKITTGSLNTPKLNKIKRFKKKKKRLEAALKRAQKKKRKKRIAALRKRIRATDRMISMYKRMLCR